MIIMEFSRKTKGVTLMRSWVIYALIFTLVFAGGCSIKKEADSKVLPNTAAFQDEFTRSLLDSSKLKMGTIYSSQKQVDILCFGLKMR